MAKHTATKPLTGLKVAFVGKFAYYQEHYRERWATDAGAAVVPATDTFDYLVYGEGRGGKPPGDVAKIQKRLPSVAVLSLADFAALLLPAPAAILGAVKNARPDHTYWENFNTLVATTTGRSCDLTGTDFRGTYLQGAKFGWAILSRCNFADADAQYADLSHTYVVDGATFDRAKLYAATIRRAKNCTFRGADMHETWADSGTYEACEFRGANLERVRASLSQFTGCDFRDADAADADFHVATFDSCDFTKADLTRVRAHRATFIGAKLVGAKLSRADLRDAVLRDADLTDADLREAALAGADLTGATVDGADFAGAVLTGATLTNVDFSKAKNYAPPSTRVPGSNVLEFAQTAAGAKAFATSVRVDLGPNEYATCGLRATARGAHASTQHYRDGKDAFAWLAAPSVEQGLLNFADRWPSATLRLDTVTAKGSPTVRGAKLQALAVAAWAEAFGVNVGSDDLAAQKDAQKAAALKARDDLMARVRNEGPGVWQSINYQEKAQFNLRGADLSGANLSRLDLSGRKDLAGATFAGSDLSSAQMWGNEMPNADLAGADLAGADLRHSQLHGASFVNARLRDASLQRCKLHGADFTGADLTGANLDGAQFDAATRFPAGFVIPDDAVWTGDGPRPGSKPVPAVAAGSLDFDAFSSGLPKRVDPSRIQKAAAMLRAERFQLYADVTDTDLTGVVKSQSSKDLVYSCRLASDGQFCCGTQNLKPCGGLQGALCKHLLVLVVGLAKAGKLDPAVADNWVAASKSHKPTLNKDALGETFLKYKGAEAGELDWRPTETVPEDFYTM